MGCASAFSSDLAKLILGKIGEIGRVVVGHDSFSYCGAGCFDEVASRSDTVSEVSCGRKYRP